MKVLSKKKEKQTQTKTKTKKKRLFVRCFNLSADFGLDMTTFKCVSLSQTNPKHLKCFLNTYANFIGMTYLFFFFVFDILMSNKNAVIVCFLIV